MFSFRREEGVREVERDSGEGWGEGVVAAEGGGTRRKLAGETGAGAEMAAVGAATREIRLSWSGGRTGLRILSYLCVWGCGARGGSGGLVLELLSNL